MSNIEKSKVQEIVTLHNEIAGHLKMSLEKAIRIGELLIEQKTSLKHGEWLPWIEANLPFSRQTADNYRRCYENKDKLLSVGNLIEAYKLLAPPKQHYIIDKCSDCKHWDEESFGDSLKHGMPKKCERAWKYIRGDDFTFSESLDEIDKIVFKQMFIEVTGLENIPENFGDEEMAMAGELLHELRKRI